MTVGANKNANTIPGCIGSHIIAYYYILLPSARQGNIFTSVCHFVHEEGGICPSACWHAPRQTPFPRADTPWEDTPHRHTATAPDGMHPTGMHSCLKILESLTLTQNAKHWSEVFHLPKLHRQLMAQGMGINRVSLAANQRLGRLKEFSIARGFCVKHGVWRARHSDWIRNSFVMVVYKNFFLKFSQNFLS